MGVELTWQGQRRHVGCNPKYDEYYAWQNQEVEDTINGKWDVIGTEQLPDGTVRQIFRDEENWQKWKSNYLPDGYVIGRDYIQSYQKEHHIIEVAE